MNRPLRTLLFLAVAMPLAACDATPATDAAAEVERATSVLGVDMETVAREVRQEMDTGNIRFGDTPDTEGSADDRGAHITPEGGLLIDGQPVEVDAGQRELLLAYRAQVAEIAMAGARVGLQGADLATKAMGEAFRGVLSGDTEGMEKRIEAEAGKIEAEAQKICDELGPLYELQQSIAAAIPETAPYATMTQADVDECRTHDGGMHIDLEGTDGAGANDAEAEHDAARAAEDASAAGG